MGLLLQLLFLLLVSAPPQSFVLTGNVRDSAGRAISNVRVELIDQNSQTLGTVFADTSGRYEFRGLASGRYVVHVEPTGTPYEPRSEQIELQALALVNAPTETMHVDIILKPRKGGETRATTQPVFVQQVPEPARVEYRKGLKEIEKNRPESGIAALRKGIELFPDYYDALELLGSEMVKLGQYDPALPVLVHAIQVNDTSPRSFYALGVAHLNLNHLPDAITCLLKAEAMDGNNPNVHMMLGLAYGKSNMLDKSEDSLRKAYEIGGDRAADAHLYLAGIYNAQAKYSTAVRELELYLKEAKDLKDTSRIRKMIDSLKAKDRSKN